MAATDVTKISEAAWHGDASRFTIDRWRASCLIDKGGDSTAKSNFSLPCREPDGTLSRAGVHAAAARLSSVDCSADQKATAARKLIGLYHQLGEQPPDSLLANSSGRSHVPPDIETLCLGRSVEVRSGAGGAMKIGGYAAVFGQKSRVMGSMVEIVQPSFFTKSMNEGWKHVVCRANHQDEMLIGTTESGTLRLAVDNVGLDYEADVPQCRSDIYELVSTHRIDKSSFAFMCYDDDWKHDEGIPVRHLISGRLVDTAPVSNPAYSQTTVSMRSLARLKDCPIETVENLAAKDELSKLFIRTDNRDAPKKPTPHQQVVSIEARRFHEPAPTGQQQVVAVFSQRWPSKPLTSKQFLMEVLGRWTPTP